MARILLDTTVLIDALRGRPAAQRLVSLRRTGAEPWVCVISAEEIWRGLLPGEEPQGAPSVQRLADGAAGRRRGHAGRCVWRREFAARGVTLHQADCLIAAAAVRIGAALATANVGDYPMAAVDLMPWPVGA